jgi:hypothetical protein
METAALPGPLRLTREERDDEQAMVSRLLFGNVDKTRGFENLSGRQKFGTGLMLCSFVSLNPEGGASRGGRAEDRTGLVEGG